MKVTFSLKNFKMITNFAQINLFSCFFEKKVNNSVGFINLVEKKWRIRIKRLVAAPTLLVVSHFLLLIARLLESK